MKRLLLIGVWVVGLALMVGGLYLQAGSTPEPGHCPVCHAKGVPVPDRESLAHCECEKWWVGSPVRLAFGDCSKRQCQDGDEEPKLMWVEMPLYRCPHDGLLFTEPE